VYCILPRFSGNRVVACATKQILAGEEINNCYGESGGGYLRDSEIHLLYCTASMWMPIGPQVGRMKRIERQAELKRRFFFDCCCPACEGYLYYCPSPQSLCHLHPYLKNGEYLYIYSYFRTCRLQLCNNWNMESPQFFICPTELLLSCITGKLWWMHLLVLSVKVPCKSWVKAITSAWTANTFASYWKKREWYCRVQFVCTTCRYLKCLVSCAAERSKEYVWSSVHTWQHMWVHVRVRCIRAEATWTR